jgi:hypothetical protein
VRGRSWPKIPATNHQYYLMVCEEATATAKGC